MTIYDKREIVYERSGKNKITIKRHCFHRVITVVSVRYCVTRLFYSSKTIIVLTPSTIRWKVRVLMSKLL